MPCISRINLLLLGCFLLPCSPSCKPSGDARDDSGGNIFLAIQNGTVSIRKWRKQLRRISWINFIICVILKRIFVRRRHARVGCGFGEQNTLMVSPNRRNCEKASDTSAVVLYQDAFLVASPRCARFWRRCTPDLHRLFELNAPRKYASENVKNYAAGCDSAYTKETYIHHYYVDIVTPLLEKAKKLNRASECWVAFGVVNP